MNNQGAITLKTRVTGGAIIHNHNESLAVKLRYLNSLISSLRTRASARKFMRRKIAQIVRCFSP
jgi:hypothetical protein